MGSSKRIDSNRAKGIGRRVRRAGHRRPDERASNTPPVRPHIDEIMGRLSDAICGRNGGECVAWRAGTRRQHVRAEVGDEVTTLLHGVRCVRRAYDSLDVALRAVRP
jgi:hypothetical protein